MPHTRTLCFTRPCTSAAFSFLATPRVRHQTSPPQTRPAFLCVPLLYPPTTLPVGAVEVWLLETESAIRRTLHRIAGEALEAYVGADRARWILDWPGQLVLNCSQVFWTREVTAAIEAAGSKGLAAYGEQCTHELNKIVNLVRGQLTSLERATCGALVVIDVHARDVTLDMAGRGVEDVRDFDWESQLRYYWEFHEAPPSGAHAGETLVVRMINAEALYGWVGGGVGWNLSRFLPSCLGGSCRKARGGVAGRAGR